MLKHESTRRGHRGLASGAFAAALLLLPAGTALALESGGTQGGAPAEPTESRPSLTALSLDELRMLVDDLSVANEELREDNSSLQDAVDALAVDRDRLADSIARFDDLRGPLEADRQLLLDLRKELPTTRPEAEAQLARIRALALRSDPQGLGRLIDRVDETSTAFLDWRFGEYGSSDEFSAAYVQSGANAFDRNYNELRSGVLLSVANRLDGLLTALDRVR